ncbi:MULTISPECIES: thioesterase family protein [Sphingomonas]|uniref:Thioesterase family protein n=1 Tax=Sphingomonas ginsenosidimutans TaxID=862134 RepID=A0A2A4I144_9SPHN|nr:MULTISPECIES: thioesterase family protein [Sphingomonas]MBY0302068.1 thioesterase family protein [Sphingomonas ginsenosidimutans]PCG10344.1 thioesterase family protein [Sphingomonas ginsenosidimutans]
MNDDAIFQPDGTGYRATTHAAGPWHPQMQHGGAPSALVAHVAEGVPTLAPMRIARVTVELLRPVPVAHLDTEVEILREGRKLQLVQVRLLAEGTEVTRATVLRLRTADTDVPDAARPPLPDVLPDDVAPGGLGIGGAVGFASNFEMRRVRGGFGELGPGRMWFRQHRALVAGRALAPLERAMTVADFSNGIAPVLPFADWTFLNADLTVSLARAPEGEWIFSDAETWPGGDGIALAMTRLADRRGYFGRAIQTLLLERR